MISNEYTTDVLMPENPKTKRASQTISDICCDITGRVTRCQEVLDLIYAKLRSVDSDSKAIKPDASSASIEAHLYCINERCGDLEKSTTSILELL